MGTPLPRNAAILAYISCNTVRNRYSGSFELKNTTHEILFSNRVPNPPGLQEKGKTVTDIFPYLHEQVISELYQLIKNFVPRGAWIPLWAFSIDGLDDGRSHWGLYLVNVDIYDDNVTYNTKLYKLGEDGMAHESNMVAYPI